MPLIRLTKTLTIAVAHELDLPYESPCNNLHGHNLAITVVCEGDPEELHHGMLIDFTEISQIVKHYDHRNLNDLLVPEQRTSEMLAKILCERIPHCVSVEVKESEGNSACYIR